MNWINNLYIIVVFNETTNGSENMTHWFAEILAAMGGNED